MLKQYIMLFVLVMLMVKTNAQPPFYYYKGDSVKLVQNQDQLLILINPNNFDANKAHIISQISLDTSFHYLYDMGMSLLLHRNTGNLTSVSDELNKYIYDTSICYASFVYGSVDSSYVALTGQVLVFLAPGYDSNSIHTLADAYGLKRMLQDEIHPEMYRLFFNQQLSANTMQIANVLYQSGDFNFAEPDFYISTHLLGSSASCGAPSPTIYHDPFYYNTSASAPTQWALYNDGSLPYYTTNYGIGTPTANADINVCNAWNFSTPKGTVENILGDGIEVAVLDVGVDINHPDFVDYSSGLPVSNILPGHDECPKISCLGAAGTPASGDTHGTNCAGIIGALQNNINMSYTYEGVSGVAPKVKIIPVRIGYSSPPPSNSLQTDYASIIDAIEWASGVINGANADVLSNSWTVPYGSRGVDMAIADATTLGRHGLGCVFVFGSGNGNADSLAYPSRDNPSSICVGAMNMCNQRKTPTSCDNDHSFAGSNYGPIPPIASDKNMLSVTAPGVHIVTTQISGGASDYDFDFSGTSAATPHVAGIAALMLAANPCLTSAEVKNIIELSATKVGSYSYSYAMPNGSWDPEMGYGKANAGDAVKMAHDIYKQNKVENTGVSYASAHMLFSGSNVTTLIPSGYYQVDANAKVTFKAAEAILLEPGFKSTFGTTTGSYFLGEITSSCARADHHYKQPTPHSSGPLVKSVTSGAGISDISAYPNPVQDQLTVSFSLPKDESAIFRVTNVVGQQMLNDINSFFNAGTNKQIITVASLIPGIYLISIKTPDATAEFKFIKE